MSACAAHSEVYVFPLIPQTWNKLHLAEWPMEQVVYLRGHFPYIFSNKGLCRRVLHCDGPKDRHYRTASCSHRKLGLLVTMNTRWIHLLQAQNMRLVKLLKNCSTYCIQIACTVYALKTSRSGKMAHISAQQGTWCFCRDYCREAPLYQHHLTPNI